MDLNSYIKQLLKHISIKPMGTKKPMGKIKPMGKKKSKLSYIKQLLKSLYKKILLS